MIVEGLILLALFICIHTSLLEMVVRRLSRKEIMHRIRSPGLMLFLHAL